MRGFNLNLDLDLGFDDLFGRPTRKRAKSKSRKRTTTSNTTRTMFYEPPRHKEIAKIVTFESVEGAKKAAKKLFLLFKKAKNSDRKLIILRAVQLAANRARAGAKNPKFSLETRRKWLTISKIYEKVSEKMEKLYR